MGALSASTSTVNWLVEDDILLKNAVETGASLESLAKGAVCFSRKFTLQEIQDRWNSLLYDPEVSTQASSRMAEYENELSTSDPAKAHKLFNSKAKDFAFQKRKIDSIKNLYYAMRKRIRNDPCNSADLGFLVSPCSCTAIGGECICGGVSKLSQGHHIINDIEPGLSSVRHYGQVGANYNGGHVYPEMNGHSFNTKHPETMSRDGDPTNIVPYGYSDVGEMFEQHAYGAKNHGSTEGNNASLKGITDFHDSMQFQQLDSNRCGVAESKTLVIPNQVGVDHVHFSSNVQEPMPLHVTDQPEGSQAPGGAIWSGVQARGTLTFSDDKKIKSENRDSLTFEGSLDGGICTSDLEHTELPDNDFIDFPFFNNGEEFDMLNGEDFLNSPNEANQEDLDELESKVIPGVRATMQTLTHPNETNMSCDLINPGHLKDNFADVSGIILVPASLEVPCPGRIFMCMLNTEDPDIPCNDDDVTPGEYPQCSTSAFGQNSENTIRSASPATSPPSNPEHSNASDLAPIKVEDMANVVPSQTMKLSPSTSEQKEGPMALNIGSVQVAKPSEGASTTGVLLTSNIGTTDANTCMPALPSFGAAGFGEGSPCSLNQRESFDNSHDLTLQNSVQVPDQMQYNPHDNRHELGNEAVLPNCMASNAQSDLGIEDHVATVPPPAQAEEFSDNENDIPNYYDLEALILDQDLIPWDQDSDFMHPEVTRFQHPESRKSLIRLEQGARSYLNRAIMSRGAFAVIYGLHLKYFIKDSEVTLGRETEDIKVDIDLGKEGRANKISRRQAVIKMDETGSFHIKNTGKYPIFVNSKEIPSCKRINLSSDSLIEIKDMRFIFHVNQDAVKQYIARDLKAEP